MNDAARRVQRTYLTLTLFATLASSLIWGVNTLFLLDAGLSNTQAFTANAFFTVGQVVFEVPTGVVADTYGRRVSYLLGAATLFVSTSLYLLMWQIQAPLWGWAASSAVIGLGFTFFSGAVEAWLVDALTFSKYEGNLEAMFAKGQTIGGVAMLIGSVAGGVIAQASNLGVPYVVRAALLLVTMGIAWIAMRDLGFTPDHDSSAMQAIRGIVKASVDNGLRNRPIRWLMLAAPFTWGVSTYAFYAMQPYLLELYGDSEAYSVAGLAAAIVAGAQIVGGLIVPLVTRLFSRRTHALITGSVVGALALVLIGWTSSFWVAVGFLVVWAMAWSAAMPVRQAYLNQLIPSEQRATVLSFDALMGSTGGVVAQPALGRAADVWSYSSTYFISGAIQALAVPFIWLARREAAPSDPIETADTTAAT
ncbi:MAG: MFS transporter [Acidimicrobiia bacterium]|nr:MFS transporter [Acidimicrobiia bacterium]